MFAPVGYAFFGLLISCSVFAAAPVSELGGQTSSPAPVVAPQAPVEEPKVLSGDVHYQVQILQDEVRTLRGMMEELNNEVRLLKKRQMDDYMDLDRRLSTPAAGQARPSSLSGANTTQTVVGEAVESSPAGASHTASPASGAEAAHYNNAYAQLKAGKVAAAVAQFKAHISKYPNGKYVANSHYWLGEIYVLQNKLELARQSFTTVLESYPAHRKASDSTYKLGQVYFMQGNKAKAKGLLEKAAAGNGNAARLARSYLAENF
jgi:tol-pal system protein YbgF